MNCCSPNPLTISVYRGKLVFEQVFDHHLFAETLSKEEMAFPTRGHISCSPSGPKFQAEGNIETQGEIPDKVYEMDMINLIDNEIRLRKTADSESKVWKVLKQNEFNELKTGDFFKLGLVEFRVKELGLNGNHDNANLKTTHQELSNSRVSGISELSSDKRCRICLDNSYEEDDPFLSLCRCSGSVKYTHFSCLKAWFKKFLFKENVRSTTYYKVMDAYCEICRTRIPEKFQISSKEYSLIDIERPSCPFAIFQAKIYDVSAFSIEPEMSTEIQVVRLQKTKNMIGSSEFSDFHILDETISLRHAQLRITNQKLMLRDRSSRFGTLVDLKTNNAFNSVDGITLQFESLVLHIKKQKSFFNWFQKNQDYNLRVQSIEKQWHKNSLA